MNGTKHLSTMFLPTVGEDMTEAEVRFSIMDAIIKGIV